MTVQNEVLLTPRLRLRWLQPNSEVDQRFIIELVNDPDWIAHIGRRNVSTCEQAEAFMRDGPVAMCQRLGFGLFMVERRDDATPMGMCGLIQRDTLPDVDLGYAFLPSARGQGLAREAAAAVVRWGRHEFGLKRVVAIVTPANFASLRLLASLGFTDEGTVQMPPDNETLRLLAWTAAPA
ncbi:GNAT family N-acetyltransferase [Ideonella sp. DXS29W]|uniref:GNAT family N-acetyltransferase n=1 Tax=Ideonella lacteola TaxID=2984193 RepID=A0ABU9BNW4_9BURK